MQESGRNAWTLRRLFLHAAQQARTQANFTTLSFYSNSGSTQFRNDLFALGIFSTRPNLCGQRLSNAQLSLYHDNFFMPSGLQQNDFMKGMRLNIAVERDDHSL
jgi:UPF0176 protein